MSHKNENLNNIDSFSLSPRFRAVKVLRFSKVGPVSDRKVNLVGTFVGQNVRKNPKKVTEKREFLRKTSFRPNRFFYMVTTEIFDFSNFYEICRKRENFFPLVFLQVAIEKTHNIIMGKILCAISLPHNSNIDENIHQNHEYLQIILHTYKFFVKIKY
ncbi:Uncharacterized protein FWK35_00002646 [Aphis craccivora]|uniref:Uncharacterized protein n=1 Tax=Aphis craccivora TaxID=307492 RepID=A0A6G0YW23_APHCR|nr:Uncharacterized protein FWK35_00002646 [Aphis craccivora]